MNAKLGHVRHLNGMGPSSGEHFENEFIPTGSGIVLHFIGPQTRFTQIAWISRLDEQKRTFEFIVPLSGDRMIGVDGSYGATFPVDRVRELRAAFEPAP